MKQYDSYKDSGVEWIGEVPSHWEILRGKYVLSILSGFPFDSKKFEYDDRYMPLIRIRDINNSSTEVYYSGDYPKESVIKKGEVLIGMDGDFNVSRWNGPNALLNQRVCKINECSKMNTRYAFYMLSLPLTVINNVTYATTVKHLSVYDIYNTFLPVPTIIEQEGIANYLDKKCSEIDNVISAQQKRIALLQELKQSVITHAVTKGLNPNVEMKDSGMEWIGDIPSNWNNLRLRFVCELRNGYTPSKANPEFWEDGTIPWYRMEDIRECGRKLKEAKQYITEDAVKGGGLFEAGSFILATTATIGEHAVLIVDSLANQRFTNLKIRKSLSQKLLGDYFFYYLYMVDDYCKATTKTSTFPAVSMELLKNCHIVFPPVKEQYKIIDYLDKRCASIDSSISKAQHQVELLQEYKQSLITEVVTGKRKVC